MSAPHTPRARGDRDRDAGDTLVEILISVAILGIVAAALIGGFLNAVSSSSVYRGAASADAVLRTAVDSVTTQMQQNAAAAFACPEDSAVYAVSGLPSGFSSTLTSLNYWVNGTEQSTCSADATQFVTLTVAYTTNGHSETTHGTFAVNDPQAAPVQVGVTATTLVFLSTGGPSNTTAGTAIPNQPLVAVEDCNFAPCRIVTTDLSPVTLAITSGSGTPGAQLANCTGTEFYGVVNFAHCEIDVAGSGYTLTATDGTLTGTSGTFTVNPGPAVSLAFSQSPVSTAGAQAGTGGAAFGQQPVVTLQDAYGNVATEDTSTVTLAITSGTGTAGANFTCGSAPNYSEQQAVSSGLATFSGCSIDKAGTGYTLAATDGSLSSATSLAFRIGVGSGAKLVFTTQPGGTITGGTAFPTQPVVTVEDAGGNTVTTDNSTVHLAITTGTGAAGANLGCSPSTNNQTASSGVATFAGCSVTTAATGYTLTATDGTLTAATSIGFNVGVGPAAQVAFSNEPGGTITAASAFPAQPVVAVEDAGGNTVTSNGSTVTLSITTGTGTAGASLTCAPANDQQTASSGVATFSGCAINKAGNGYTLTAKDGSLSAGTSTTFNVVAGPPSLLVFSTEPGGAISAGTAFPTQPVVTVEDAEGDPVTSPSSSVTLSITSGTGTAGASLSCTHTTVTTVNGVATFAGCSINKGGSGYTLTAQDGSFTQAISTSFTVVGPPAKLVYTTPPPASVAKSTNFTVGVSVEDSLGNTVTTDTSTVTLSSPNLSCTGGTSKSATNGVATFTCKYTASASLGNHTLSASDSTAGVTGTSATVDVT